MTTSLTMNDAVKHAAATTRQAAASTAHTLSSLAGEAQSKLGDLDLPMPKRRRRTSRRRWVIALAVLGSLAAVIAKRRGGTQRHDDRDVIDSAPVPAPEPSSLTSVG